MHCEASGGSGLLDVYLARGLSAVAAAVARASKRLVERVNLWRGPPRARGCFVFARGARRATRESKHVAAEQPRAQSVKIIVRGHWMAGNVRDSGRLVPVGGGGRGGDPNQPSA